MSVGYIVVNVYTSRAQIPLKNAYVTVTSGKAPEVTLLGFRTTNENGTTESISIETPNVDLSLAPTQPDVQPFSTCNIRISHPEYYTTIINDVQVFANTQTLQEVELIPLEENSEAQDRLIRRTVPAQNL